MANQQMANWLIYGKLAYIWRIDYGKSAYGEKAYRKMTSYWKKGYPEGCLFSDFSTSFANKVCCKKKKSQTKFYRLMDS